MHIKIITLKSSSNEELSSMIEDAYNGLIAEIRHTIRDVLITQSSQGTYTAFIIYYV